MIDFLHTYGAFILVVSVLLILPLLVIVCSAFLSDGSDADHQVTREEGKRLRHEGRAHE